jgi:hypothetical protein
MENTIVETWKDIKSYEGFYQASNLGRIKSVRSEKIMSVKKHSRDYPQINFHVNGVRKLLYVHRIIAETFLENSEKLKTVDHIDENKKNNSAINLKWCSQNENMIIFHSRRLEKKRMQKNMKLTEKDVNHIRIESFLFKAKTLAKGYGVSRSCIDKIIAHDVWKAI